MNQRTISSSQAILFSVLSALTIVVICCLFHNNFFCVDDSEYEMLGFLRQIGHIWINGSIPFIVDSMYLGGNEMIDLGKGIFLPQNILVSLIASKFNYIQLPGIILAFINLVLVCLSALSIAKTFKLRNSYAYAFASLATIQPIFLYYYLGAWWNAGNGQAWAMVSIATFLLLKSNYNVKNIIINFVSVVFLMSAGWPHGIIGYAAFVLVTQFFELTYQRNWKKNIFLIVPSLLAFIFSLPIYSEYIYSHDLINRISGFYSDQRRLTPSWSSIVLGFFPASYDFMNTSGYKMIYFPIGFSTLFIPLALCYRKINLLWQKDANLKWLVMLIFGFFMLTQMPGQFGPLRWPFRFLPFICLFISLTVFYILENAPTIIMKGVVLSRTAYISLYIFLAGLLFLIPLYMGFDIFGLTLILLLLLFLIERELFDLKKSVLANFNKNYFIIIICTFCLVSFNSLGTHPIYLLLQIFSVLLLLICPVVINRKSQFGLSLLNFVTLVIMLNGMPTIGGLYGYEIKLSDSIQRPNNINLQGYVLSLPMNLILTESKQLSDAFSAQFGIYDIKSVNGYSPVGNKRLEAILPVHKSAHGVFSSNETLKNILSKGDNFDVCQAILMRISTVIVNKVDYDKFKDNFSRCGYTQVQVADYRQNLYVSLPLSQTNGWENNLPSAFPAIKGIDVVSHKNNVDLINIPAHNEALTLIFPRLWWYGYTAKINGQSLPVTSDKSGLLVQVNVPPSATGILKLSYFPVTWRYVWFLPLLALAGLGVLVFRYRVKK
ncbi:MAG: hypothetical protein J6568_03195 [Snodgrassella sp.]|nr:hypothetical protein [Snodgrassella sp.]